MAERDQHGAKLLGNLVEDWVVSRVAVQVHIEAKSRVVQPVVSDNYADDGIVNRVVLARHDGLIRRSSGDRKPQHLVSHLLHCHMLCPGSCRIVSGAAVASRLGSRTLAGINVRGLPRVIGRVGRGA